MQDRTTLVIFGITGDLVRRKLLPAIYELAHAKQLPEGFRLIGVTRQTISEDSVFRDLAHEISCTGDVCDLETLNWLSGRTQTISMHSIRAEDYHILKEALERSEEGADGEHTRLFYLAIPPQIFAPVVQHLGESGLNKGARLLIEKPFGYDLTSAQELIDQLKPHFDESQIYRIDHYLAKETSQNILSFRFNNPLFEAVWDSHSISSITVTATETLGIEGRATFYEHTGALRDLIQSHLLQLLALVTMEPPHTQDSAGIHASKLALLQAVANIQPYEIPTRSARGQYEGYRAEANNPDSLIETYAAVALSINTPRWEGVPMLLRTGKALNKKMTEISVVFKAGRGQAQRENTLRFRIQPDEGISLDLLAKVPGFVHKLESVDMFFDYNNSFNKEMHIDAYARVLADAISGDATLFTSSAEVLESWRIVEPLVRNWQMGDDSLETYPAGSSGPKNAQELAARFGVTWED